MAYQNLNFHDLYSNRSYTTFHPPTPIPSFHDYIPPTNFSSSYIQPSVNHSENESNMTQFHPSFGLTDEDLLNQKLDLLNQKLDQFILNKKLDLLNQKLDQFLSRRQCPVSSFTHPTPQEVCHLYSSLNHYVSDCPLAPQYPEIVQEKVQADQDSLKPVNDPFHDTYNLGCRDHSNFARGPQSQSFQNYSQSDWSFIDPSPPSWGFEIEHEKQKSTTKIEAPIHAYDQRDVYLGQSVPKPTSIQPSSIYFCQMSKISNLRSEEQFDDCVDFPNHPIEMPFESNPSSFHLIPIEKVEPEKIKLQSEFIGPVGKINNNLSIFNFEEPHDNLNFKNKNTQESLNDLYFEQISNDEPMFLNKLFEDEFNYNHEKIFVEEPKFSSNCVEEIVSIPRTPFGKKPLDLSSFTFEDPITNQKPRIHETLNDQSFEELFKNKLMILDESTRDILVSFTPPMKIIDLNFEKIFEDELKFLGDHVEDTSIELHEYKIWGSSKDENNRRRRIRKIKNKLERMKAKLTKRLSSLNSPLKRTHWESGKRSRGRNR